ncbi:MAG: Iron-sulfur cluster insertion protein ErpA [Candidatus Heimdallarchaeota archaeon LC_3]|nr:MAG: Iron-sulfur cluster insertion protein ErpA [Candidatus Heimdallarchaeota archaeon LC_3]
MSEQDLNNAISFTPSALNRVINILKNKNDANLMFRIDVIPSGCSGLTYDFKLDSEIQDNDQILNFDDIKVIASKDVLYDMTGSTIDFEETLLSSQFVVNNPLATKTCSCGISFQTESNKGRIEKC